MDFDFLPGFILGEPHRFHHGASHSIFVGTLIGLLFILLLKRIELSSKAICLCCLLSVLSHPILDFFGADYSIPYGIPLFWPFDDTYYISDFSLFLSIDKSGANLNSFIMSMLTVNNLKAVFNEIFFSIFIISLTFMLKKKGFSPVKIFGVLVGVAGMFLISGCRNLYANETTYQFNQKVIQLNLPLKDDGTGGIISVDLNNDNKMDFIITKQGHIGAWDNSGNHLWLIKRDIQLTKKSEDNGLPGWHAPGVQAGDIDEDGSIEVLFLTKSRMLCVLDGESGKIKHEIKMTSPKGTERWEHMVLCNLRGQGDHDLLLQATGNTRYRMGRHIAAYSWDALMDETNAPLWSRDDFIPNAHNGARVADLDGDGKDEVLGGTIITPKGEISYKIPLQGHIDSIFVADVRPDIDGLEVVALEEGGGWVPFKYSNTLFYYLNRIYDRLFGTGNHVFLYNMNGLIWKTHFKHREPQNAAVGDFDLKRDGLEIWCRSRYNTKQKPFVFDARGKLISIYKMEKIAPDNWTQEGVEVITTIDWTGDERQFCVAKERHTSGKVAIFDGLTGEFKQVFEEKADRLYVADVYGDWREEVIVLHGNELHIYSNSQSNPNPDKKRLWSLKHYQRSKMTWNYYNP